jgi:tetratricopeptide repeat protein/adenylate/guanylate cyclase family protein
LLDRAQAGASEGRGNLTEILSLRGRLFKDAFERAAGDASAAGLARRARDEYLRAYAIARDPYPGINAATLSTLLGERSDMERLAREVVASVEQKGVPSSTWDLATLGEALLLTGEFAGAAAQYAAAYRAAGASAGLVAAMRRQLLLLARAVPRASNILHMLPAPDVVAFAGHMIDAPDRRPPRFPPSLVAAVASAIRRQVARLHAPIVYTSAASGADLLLIEAALDRGAEVNVVLPFDKTDFVRTSVAPAGDDWVRRFDDALARATRVVMATEEGHLGDDVLFEHAALLVEGFAMLRAQQLASVPTLVCVLDAGDAARVGGTRASVERWTRNVGTPTVIDLRRIRDETSPAHADIPARASTKPATAPATLQPPVVGDRPPRTLKTMLFADFAGYSRLHDAFAPLFQQRFLEIGAEAIAASAQKPLEAKTWGDAVYAVFDRPQDGAEFALRFLERMLAVDWTAAGLSDSSQVRIALHAGPVFRGHDPVTHADSHFGSAVTRAARIEPVTPPGMIYASEAFAATLAATGQTAYALEYVGNLALAKRYGESRIYRLERR